MFPQCWTRATCVDWAAHVAQILDVSLIGQIPYTREYVRVCLYEE